MDGAKGNKGGFFAMDPEQFFGVCDLGMNEACAYLTCASGSGKDNSTSMWSVNAVEKYTNISRLRAKKAFERLIANGYLVQIRGGKHPEYQIPRPEDAKLVWLPNTLVTGLASSSAPIERLRQTGDVTILRLLVDLYLHTDVGADGGVTRDILWTEYTPREITTRGEYSIRGFTSSSRYCMPGHAVVRRYATAAEGHGSAEQFFRKVKVLTDLGLFYWIPTLFDAPDGEVIYSLKDPFDSEAQTFLETIGPELLEAIFPGSSPRYDYVAVFLSHYMSATLRGVLVPRFRQKTKLNSMGMAQTRKRNQSWEEKLGKLWHAISMGD